MSEMWRAYLVNLGKQLNFRTVEDTEGQRHHLEILGASSGGDVARFGANVIDDGLLEPWDEEVRALIDDLVVEIQSVGFRSIDMLPARYIYPSSMSNSSSCSRK